MNNAASILLLIFLALTFIQSSYEKLFAWKEHIDWLKEHFAETKLKNFIPFTLLILLILELISGIFSVVGIIELLVNNGRTFGFYGAVFSSICLLLMLFGQRLAKDYDGARNIIIYFIPTIIAVFLLS